MNVFIGVGTIVDVQANAKVLKFDLSLQQDKQCNVPCVVFNPDTEAANLIDNLQVTGEPVWLQGKISVNEFENNGKTYKYISIVVYPRNIKPLG